MQCRGRLFASSPKQYVGKGDQMGDGAIDRCTVDLVAGACRSHFNNGHHHPGIRTLFQPAVKIGQQCLFPLTISHDKTPPAGPAESSAGLILAFSGRLRRRRARGNGPALARSLRQISQTSDQLYESPQKERAQGPLLQVELRGPAPSFKSSIQEDRRSPVRAS